MKKSLNYNAVAYVVIIIGALCSLTLTYYAGRNNKSFLLSLMFMAWVLSPFIVLLLANITFKGLILNFYLSIIIALSSLICYSGILNPVGMKPAFIFLIVPLVSWVLIIIVIIRLRTLSKKRKSF
jgi:hypothetical protein